MPMVREGLIDVGYKISKEETHDFLKHKFLVKELVNEETGEILKSIGSTSDLTTSEFMDFIAEIQQWAAEFLGINIPDPGEAIEIDFNG